MSDLTTIMLDTMSEMASKRIKSTPIDLTIEAEVRMIQNVEVGEYKVFYQGAIFSAYSFNPEIVYQKGEKIFVLVPQGDMSNKKLILGRAANSGNSYANRQDMTNQYIQVGPNWLSDWYHPVKDPMQITSVSEEQRSLLESTANWDDIGFSRELMNEEELKLADDELLTYANTQEYLTLSADFETRFNSPHSSGEYALEIEAIVTNPRYIDPEAPNYDSNSTELPYEIAIFTLGFTDFTGAPYAYVTPSRNTANFKIIPGQIKGLSRIRLMQDGKMVADSIISNELDYNGNPIILSTNYSKNNIFVSNIDIHFSRKINLTDNLYYCYIETPKGNKVYSDTPSSMGKDSIDLIAHLIYGYQDILTKDTCKITWFKEQFDITSNTDGYNKLAGPGWIEINSEDANYDIDFNKLTVHREDVPYQQNYKVVIIYNEKVNNEAQTLIINSDSTYDLQIEQFTGENSLETFLRVKDLNSETAEYPCTWYRLLPDNSYIRISDFKTIEPIKINNYLVNDIVTFRAVVYEPIVDGELIANLEETIISSTANDLNVQWIGQDHFNYDVNGSITIPESLQDRTLRAKFDWIQGYGSDYSIEVLAPDGSVLGPQIYYDEGSVSGKAYTLVDSMLTDLWVDLDNVIHFHIREKYSPEKSNNNLTVRIKTYRSDEQYEVSKLITFSKDGDQGTQGSDWTAQIWPTNGHNSNTLTPIFSEPLRYAAPLVRDDNSWKNEEYPLYLRPFVKKNGISVEELGNYFYKVSWDVRFPKNHPANYGGSPIINESWLRLTDPEIIIGSAEMTKITNYTGAAQERYGAVRVIGQDYPEFEKYFDYGMSFQVKAIIEIYEGDISNGTQVASIASIFPIDVFQIRGEMQTDPNSPEYFNPTKIKTNWPQYVLYNATGYNPQTFSEPLTFKYDEAFIGAENITPKFQDMIARNGYSYYQPRPYYINRAGENGVLRAFLAEEGIPFGYYYRNQIFQLNNYGNVDINAWDGQGIDLFESDGRIMAVTIGAGYKDPFTNTFTGVIMGIDTSKTKTSFDGLIDFSDDELKKNPYLAGIYGYQNGVSSFGIMENGTAFFGRADKGGRIIIDGQSAQLYGGDWIDGHSPTLETSMKDRMRLTLMDFNSLNTEVVVDGEVVPQGDQYQFENKADYAWLYGGEVPDDPAAFTPAIEIGEYPEGFSPPVIEAGDVSDIENLDIPGRRKFLVTYDGTLYAMNAFIKGNIVTSTITGSQFMGDDGSFTLSSEGWFGVGYKEGIYFQDFEISNLDTWSSQPPDLEISQAKDPLNPNEFLDNHNYGFYIHKNGDVYANNLHLRGGDLHIGGNTSNPLSGMYIDLDGNMVNYGTTYLVGPRGTSDYAVPALETWGGVYMRGNLVSLSNVLLGAFPDIQIQNFLGENLPSSTINLFPFVVIPSSRSNATIGLWPLYAQTDGTTNGSWVGLSHGTLGQGQPIVPNFANRNAAGFPTTPLVRISSEGLWTDCILFTQNGSYGDRYRFTSSDIKGAAGFFSSSDGSTIVFGMTTNSLRLVFETADIGRFSAYGQLYLYSGGHTSSAPSRISLNPSGEIDINGNNFDFTSAGPIDILGTSGGTTNRILIHSQGTNSPVYIRSGSSPVGELRVQSDGVYITGDLYVNGTKIN